MEFSPRFTRLIKEILKREGGFVNNSADKGGATNHGITQIVYDTFRQKYKLPEQTVRYITSEEILEIYYKEYYSPLGLDITKEESSADILFDLAVNSGLSKAKSFEKLYGIDSIRLLDARYNFYIRLCKKKPTQLTFLKGWIARLNTIAFKYKLVWYRTS